MFKGNVLRSLVLVLALGLIFGFCVPFCFAEESVTSTTFYPGGDTDDSEALDAGDQPPANGQLYKPQGDLDALANAKPRELVYNSFYDGSAWVPQADGAGGGGCYVSYKAIRVCAWECTELDPDNPEGEEVCKIVCSPDACSGDGCCISGFKNMGSAGWQGAAATTTFAGSRDGRPSCTGQCSYTVGEAFVCCW